MIQIEHSAFGIEESAVAYRNVLTEGTLSWSSQTADGAAANALGPQTYDFWTPASLPAMLTVTLAEAVDCDCAAIIAHTLGSSGATVQVQARNGTDPWVTFSTVTPADDRDIFVLFADLAGTAYDQWRIRITGSTAPAVGIAWIGPRLIIPDGVQAGYVPLNLALSVELMPNITRGGQFLGNRVQKVGASTSLSLARQHRHWVQEDAAPFIAHYNAGKPFLWLSCPELLPDDAHYVWRAGDTLSASYGAGSLWADMSMEVAAYVGS